MPLAAGTKLGPYHITNLLGEGGMGEVYRARDTRLGRDVAVKILTAVIANDKEQISRFAQEARATGMLNHPNLLTIFDIGTANGAPFLVSELLEGQTLRERLVTAALPPRKAVEYALQVAHGLAAAHDKGIVHRDLKPENIFITRDERVKILDFGIAKLNPQAAGEGATFQMAATTPGMVLGTVGYMSPEQVRGEAVDQRSDIFAFGTILYEMLSGSRAFKRNSSIETLSAILKEEPPDLLDVAPNVPPALERVVRRCLEKNRDLRFQNARDLAFHLESLTAIASSTGTGHPLTTGGGSARVPQVAPTLPPVTAGSQNVLTNSPTLRTPAGAGTAPAPTRQPTAATAAPRPRPTQTPVSRKKAVSRALLWLLALVSIVGAAYGGYRYAQLQRSVSGILEFHRVTFRRGEIRTARFSSDGDMIVYSAAWDGKPTELFITTRQNPESRAVGIPDAEIAAVSKTAELAIILKRDRTSGLGTLARVPLVGGVPRNVADGVSHAEWSVDGSKLAAIRQVNGPFRIEYPIGSVKYQTSHRIRDIRFSPAGDRLAFIEERAGAHDISVMDAQSGRVETVAHGWRKGAQGLAWSNDGEEIWFTGTDSSAPPALYALNLHGEHRLVQKLTGSLRLQDIAPSGRILLMHSTWRAALNYQAPGETTERDLAWFDWSIVSDLSADGKTILFNETREGGGRGSAIYIRHVDSEAPVRLGEGYGDALSPDGKWALSHQGPKLVLLATGSGEPQEVKAEGSFDLGASWLPDSRRVVVAGATPNKGYALHLVDVLSGTDRAISPEGLWGEAFRPFVVSPDGRWVAGMSRDRTIMLYSTERGTAPIKVPSVEPMEIPMQWGADGKTLYVYRPTALPAQVYRIDLTTGVRELWKEFKPLDPAGVYRIAPIFATSDGSAYAYNSLRVLGELYVAEWQTAGEGQGEAVPQSR